MARIVVEETLDAPVEHVFDRISDHAAYAEMFTFVTRSSLSREGSPDPNGLGAVRSIGCGPIRFAEEITAFERPVRMDYLIKSVNAPVEHQGGSIRLEPRGEATHVLWTSEFSATLALVGRPYEAVMAAVFARGFRSMLKRIEMLPAEAPQPTAAPS